MNQFKLIGEFPLEWVKAEMDIKNGKTGKGIMGKGRKGIMGKGNQKNSTKEHFKILRLKKVINNWIRVGGILIVGSLFLGCGYRPAIQYQEKILGDQIDLRQQVSAKNPEMEAFIKDGLIEHVYTTLGKQLGKGESVVGVKIGKTDLIPIDYDQQGYPILYRAEVEIKATIKGIDGKNHRYSATGSYDFAVTSQGVVNHQMELNALRLASSQAIYKLLARIGIDGSKIEKGEIEKGKPEKGKTD